MTTTKGVLQSPRMNGFISPAAWSLVESHFSSYAKEVLAKVIDFVIVSASTFIFNFK